MLKADGRMLVSDIVAEDLPDEIASHRHLYSSCLAGAVRESDYLQGLRDAGLMDVEVKERLLYDASQLNAFIGSELQPDGDSCCGQERDTGALAEKWAPRLEGKIASVQAFARKPG